MPTWNSRGLRGSTLEDLLNRTNEKYLEHDLALIQKIPTPITPINIDKASRHITLAYFEQKSTVDYIGAVQGIPICFDAKECNTDTFPLANIHEHQVAFMKAFEKQEGVAFILISFTHRDEFYYLLFAELMKYANRMCAQLNDGTHVASVAVLYDGEADWVGDHMPMQKVGRALIENQIEFDVVSIDMLKNLMTSN